MIVVTAQGTTVEVPTDPVAPGVPGTPNAGQALVRMSYLVTLTDTDGTVWDLNNGPVTLLAGAKLFGTPPVTQQRKQSPTIAGTRRTGVRIEERPLLLPVSVKGYGDWEAYRATDVAFFNGLDPDRPVVVTVTSPDAIARSLPCYFESDGDVEDEYDPLLFARKKYVLGLIAPDPYWRGDPVVKTLVATDTSLPLFPGPPFDIITGESLAEASISNLGDVPAWPRYTITGPVTAFTVGVGDAVVSSTAPVAAGDQVVIDSAPRARTVLSGGGARLYEQMDRVQFRPVPRGTDVPITVSVEGAGSSTQVMVELTPLFRRPFGVPDPPPIEPPPVDPPPIEPPPVDPPPVTLNFFGIDTDGAVYFDSAGVPAASAAVLRLDTDGMPYHDVTGTGPGALLTGGVDTDGVPYFVVAAESSSGTFTATFTDTF
ncbi:MAG TPA: hypothetical protein VF642_12250 [Propionibacteriaceae bacterium]|jgi:hypothetical protein